MAIHTLYADQTIELRFSVDDKIGYGTIRVECEENGDVAVYEHFTTSMTETAGKLLWHSAAPVIARDRREPVAVVTAICRLTNPELAWLQMSLTNVMESFKFAPPECHPLIFENLSKVFSSVFPSRMGDWTRGHRQAYRIWMNDARAC